MKRLYLDDIRNPQTDGWDIVRNYEDFIKWVKINDLPDEVSFDHDLGEDIDKQKIANGVSKHKSREEKKYTKSGYDCAQWLGQYCIDNKKPFPRWNVHSANPVGKLNIESYILNVIKYLNTIMP